METAVKAILRGPVRLFRKWMARHAIEGLISDEAAILNIVGNALRETLDIVNSEEEQEIVSLIEQRRTSLLGSKKRIPVIDFGAGNSYSNRTEEEMKQGIQSMAFVSKVCKASKPAFWAMFLFKLIRKFEPNSCIELGSCVGISAAYQAAALRLNKKGKLQTLEGSPEIAKIAEDTLAGLDLENASVITGPFHETYRSVLEAGNPVDFLFNDGHHDHDAVLRYFHEALPYLSEEALIVFDDITWSPGMRKAWTEIEGDERVAISIDLHTIGIAFISRKEATKSSIHIPLS